MLRELNTLIAVAREGTFAAAGARVGLTQAAISARMQRLESNLGFALFDRTGRTARLNAIGQRTLKQAQEVLRLYAKLGTDDDGAPLSRLVSIGAIASMQRSGLPDALAQVHAQFPDMRSRVIPGVSLQLLELVDAGEIDVAAIIRPPFALQSDLRWIPLASEPFRLLVPRKIAGEDWAGLLSTRPFIRYDRASFGGRRVDRFLRAAQIRVQDVCELDELEAIVRLVAAGLGVALLPETSAQKRWPAAVRAIDLGSDTFHREVGLVVRARGEASQPARGLIAALCEAYGRSGRGDRAAGAGRVGKAEAPRRARGTSGATRSGSKAG